jgi:hypothetical protein
MDDFDGFRDEPPSLHKYLYANADPVNHLDPSGRASLSEYGIKIRLIALRTVQALRRLARQIICILVKVASYINPALDLPASLIEFAFCKCKPTGGGGPRPDEILKRSAGGPESAGRLGRHAKASQENPTERVHGISTTAGPPNFDGRPHRELPRSEVEKHFPVHNTPQPNDPLHRTVELPDPVTPDIAKLWNDLWGFKKCK